MLSERRGLLLGRRWGPQLATSGDLYLATSGDFYMATDSWWSPLALSSLAT
jgi:hypothetical protein